MTPEDADLVRSLELAANPMCWRAADAIERLSAEKEAAEADADRLTAALTAARKIVAGPDTVGSRIVRLCILLAQTGDDRG